MGRRSGQGASTVATGLTGRDEDLSRAREMALTLVRGQALAPAVAADLEVVLDEVLSSIVRHGFRDGREHEIRITLAVDGDVVVVTVEDDGPAFNPLTHPLPDRNTPLEGRTVGGLGIQLIRGLMDEVSHQRVGERNRLVLRRRRPGPEAKRKPEG